MYAYITDGASCLFLLVQTITLIDFAYLWAEEWAMRFNKGNKCYGVLLIVFALFLYAGCGFILVEMFIAFANGCASNWIWLIVNCLLPIAWTVLIILKFHPTGSIITSGSVSIIITYLGWTGLLSSSDEACNPFRHNSIYVILQMIGSFSLMILCVFYHAYVGKSSIAYKEAKLKNLNSIDEKPKDENANVNSTTEDQDDDEGEKVQIAAEKENNDGPIINKGEFGLGNPGGIDKESHEWKYRDYSTNHYVFFHLFMMLCSMYVCSIFTSWGYTRKNNSGQWNFQSAETVLFVIKWINICLFILLYTWTVIAPRLCKKREFVNKKIEYNYNF